MLNPIKVSFLVTDENEKDDINRRNGQGPNTWSSSY